MENNHDLVKELMKKTILLAFILCAFATVASAQVFTSSATITISRKSDGANGGSQNKADQALKADIERYVVGVAGSIVNPTAKMGRAIACRSGTRLETRQSTLTFTTAMLLRARLPLSITNLICEA